MHMFTDTLNVYKTASQVLCFQCNTYSDFSKSAPATSHNYKKYLKKNNLKLTQKQNIFKQTDTSKSTMKANSNETKLKTGRNNEIKRTNLKIQNYKNSGDSQEMLQCSCNRLGRNRLLDRVRKKKRIRDVFEKHKDKCELKCE